MTKRYDFRFVVEGSGPFPLDMLRYDRCFPRTEDSANRAQGGRITRQVELLRVDAPGYWHPTVARWESFGWKVWEVERLSSPFAR